MSANQHPATPQPDFDVQVITFEHAVSASMRGAVELIGGGLCLAFAWEFVIWVARDFPNAAYVLLGPDALSMLVQAIVAVLGWFLMIEGKNKLLFVTLVYVIDQWLGQRNASMKRRAPVDPFD